MRIVPFRRTGAAVALLSKVVDSIAAKLAWFEALSERMDICRDIVQQPVIPGAAGSVGIVDDKGDPQ